MLNESLSQDLSGTSCGSRSKLNLNNIVLEINLIYKKKLICIAKISSLSCQHQVAMKIIWNELITKAKSKK